MWWSTSKELKTIVEKRILSIVQIGIWNVKKNYNYEKKKQKQKRRTNNMNKTQNKPLTRYQRSRQCRAEGEQDLSSRGPFWIGFGAWCSESHLSALRSWERGHLTQDCGFKCGKREEGTRGEGRNLQWWLESQRTRSHSLQLTSAQRCLQLVGYHKTAIKKIKKCFARRWVISYPNICVLIVCADKRERK